MTYYTYNVADNLASKYIENGGNVIKFPGSLVDNYLLYGHKLKTTVIKEVYLSCYSSGVTIRQYKKIPQKYEKVVELIESDENEKAEKLFFS